MIVSCVFRCIMHVYIDRVRKQILETIGLMTTFLICEAAFSFYVSHHCYLKTVKYLSAGPETILLNVATLWPTKDLNQKLLASSW